MSEPFWTPLGGQPVDYEGEYNPATQYAPGDVVRYNGVDYLAVNPSLGSTPPVAAQPNAELAYGENVTTVTPSATTAATAVALITLPAITFDGVTAIMLEFYCAQVTPPGSASLIVNLWDGAVDLGRWARVSAPSSTQSVLARTKRTPSAGAHTFSARVWVTVAGGQVDGAPPSMPTYMRMVRA